MRVGEQHHPGVGVGTPSSRDEMGEDGEDF